LSFLSFGDRIISNIVERRVFLTFSDWIYSRYPADSAINGRWGILHISVVIFCVLAILAVSFLRKKDIKTKRTVVFILAGLIFLFEISRRIINLSRGEITTLNQFLVIMLPRPFCAISCWMVMLSPILNKRSFYNLASACALLNAVVFFAYPAVGFNDKYILFENVYSITTHALLLISSVSLITLRFAKFYFPPKNEIIGLVLIYLYGFAEIFLLKIEADPLYFMEGGDVQDFLGVGYSAYLVIYIGFLIFYFSAFYLTEFLCKNSKSLKN
jgi:hypothetical protein